MLAGNEREALLAVADQLGAELGYGDGSELPGDHSPFGGDGGVMSGILNSEDELLVTGVRHALAKVAAALGNGKPEPVSETVVVATLDGAEMVMRGELLRGNSAQLPALLPSFVFLVGLAVVDQERALELSQRTSDLLEGALEDSAR